MDAFLDILNDGEDYALENVTEEDSDLAAEQVHANALEAEHIVADMNRMADTAVQLENIAFIGTKIDKADKGHRALVMASLNLALAGTGKKYDAIAPGMESETGDEISMEGVTDMVKKVYDAIVRQLKKLWAKMKEFWYNMTAAAPKIAKAAQKMREKAEKSHTKSSEAKTVTLGREANALTLDFVIAKSAKDIDGGLQATEEAVTAVFNDLGKDLKGVGEDISNSLSDFDVEDPKTGLTNLCNSFGDKEIMTTLSKSLKGSPPASNDKRHPDDAEVTRTESMLGSKAVFIVKGVMEKGESTPLNRARAIRRNSVQVLDRYVNKKDALEEGDITTLTPSEVIMLCDRIVTIATMIGSYQKSKTPAELEKIIGKIQKSTDKLAKQADKNREDTSDEGAYVRSGLDFLRFYAGLCQNPQSQVANAAFAGCRAVLTASSKSLSTYK